ncbi:hypothetical protein GNP94_22000 [Paenibacillus campinasensis]|uniref:Phage gp6-like head-tail connector protein n=1 Tax=Paenibacillus campinasensis TaxID=66347 RepID=A0ABW9T6X9_9BACL|nr:hypothetical protein [Paenibacillus campinasensis]MUG68647.1 hypothetical protein [Paenibacillus campinasensis]
MVLRNFPVFGGTARVGEQEVPILPNDDGLIFSSHGWPAGQRNIEVEYEAGYTLPGEETSEQPRTLPEVVEMACMFTMQGMLSQPAGNIQSERVGDVSVTYRDVDAALPLTARNLLVPYVGRWV